MYYLIYIQVIQEGPIDDEFLSQVHTLHEKMVYCDSSNSLSVDGVDLGDYTSPYFIIHPILYPSLVDE